MVAALFDTNILIDHLKAVGAARVEIERYDRKAISIISWMEVLIGTPPELSSRTRRFLEGFELIALDDEIAARTVTLRQTHRLKLPDAVIWASAQIRGSLLVTRDTKGFPFDDPGVRRPYTL